MEADQNEELGNEEIGRSSQSFSPDHGQLCSLRSEAAAQGQPPLTMVARLSKDTERKRGGAEPWKLLTNQPVSSVEDYWRIVQVYGTRWAIEQMLRLSKSELGIESVRVRQWEPRAKFLAVASLAYAFLVHLPGDGTAQYIPAILPTQDLSRQRGGRIAVAMDRRLRVRTTILGRLPNGAHLDGAGRDSGERRLRVTPKYFPSNAADRQYDRVRPTISAGADVR